MNRNPEHLKFLSPCAAVLLMFLLIPAVVASPARKHTQSRKPNQNPPVQIRMTLKFEQKRRWSRPPSPFADENYRKEWIARWEKTHDCSFKLDLNKLPASERKMLLDYLKTAGFDTSIPVPGQPITFSGTGASFSTDLPPDAYEYNIELQIGDRNSTSSFDDGSRDENRQALLTYCKNKCISLSSSSSKESRKRTH